ncbi:hypothetical protein ACH5AL_15240 [Actinacidiphila glaucinigra]|uniref:hypothetical protein n=1 Tax=Actinacidiphila glaucinigra TaxID=235986 RepID=UPI0037A272CC
MSDALIAELQRIQDEHGVMEVRVYDYADIAPDAVAAGEIERNGQGETYVLLRP